MRKLTKGTLQFYRAVVCSIILLGGVQSVLAIPAFSRKYETSCVTCHYAFPKLNAFGKVIKNNGYRYPAGDEEEMTKEEPIELGDEAYKRVFPKAVWPGKIPGTLPFSARAIGRLHYRKLGDKKSPFFEIPHELELLMGGTLGDKFSFVGEVEWEHASEFAYEFAINWDFIPAVHLKLGSVGLNISGEHHRLTAEHYSIANLKNQSGTWRLRSGAGAGMALWGAGNGIQDKGGFTYAIGVGNGQMDEDNFDINRQKEFYVQGTFKFGGLGEVGGSSSETDKSSTSNPHIDNSLKVGGFYYRGNATEDDLHDIFFVAGGYMEAWYSVVNLSATIMTMNSDYMDNVRKSLAYYTEAQCAVFPWLIVYTRFESVKKDMDDKGTNAELNLLPGFVALARANIKFSFEYLVPLDEDRKGVDKDRGTIQFDFAF